MNRAVLRVDESSLVGSGHMTRCYALACKLRSKGWKVLFVVKEIGAANQDRLLRREIEIIRIRSEESFYKCIRSDDVIIVDSYNYGVREWSEVALRGPLLSVCIDDARDTSYRADIVVLPNEMLDTSSLCLGERTELLAGLRFILIRPEIFRAKEETKKSDRRNGIVIANGGARSSRWIKRMVGMAIETGWRGSSISVISGCDLHRRDLEESCVKHGIRVHTNISEKEMALIYTGAEISIVPCSTMMLEAMIYGCPVITGWLSDNQKVSLDYFEDSGLAKNIGHLEKAGLAIFEECIEWARNNEKEILECQTRLGHELQGGVGLVLDAIEGGVERSKSALRADG